MADVLPAEQPPDKTGAPGGRFRMSPSALRARLGGDVLRSAAILAASCVALLLLGPGAGAGPVQMAVVLAITTGAVLLRTVTPLTSMLMAASLCLLMVLDGGTGAALWVAVPIVLLSYAAGRRMATVTSALIGFATVALVGLGLAVLVGNAAAWISMLLVGLLVAVLPWLAGRFRRQRAELIRAGWERAEQLELEQQIVARQARQRERARIAQDIHDSLGHDLNLLALGAGALELDQRLAPEHQEAAARLRKSAVTATERLHDAIGLLREESDRPPVDPAGGRVEDLIERAAEAGAPVMLQTEGAALPLSELAGRAVFRVTQEALTNARKHAPGASVTVRVNTAADLVTVSVRNGPGTRVGGPRPAGGGLGLIGLSERVRLAGGAFHAGATEDGGFLVRAELPRLATAIDTSATGRGAGDEPPETGRAMRRVRRRGHRELLYAGGLSLAAAVLLGAVLLGLHVFTVLSTGLNPVDFNAIRVGQSRADLAPVLPDKHISAPPPIVVEPPVPAGGDCDYYRFGRDPLDMSQDMYRLCYTADLVISKDVLRAGTGS